MNHHEEITLFIRSERADILAENALRANSAAHSYRLTFATMRDEQGHIDQGYKAELLDIEGRHLRWL